ncbi:elongation factor TS family protein [Loa loa]|uniref:Elongation factor Ts, mitochondrial n=1 Tax=Loa loa TaxID=7209 RepID=A0A1I7VSR7_LOALO|nr:elongation factor TS family protein [Loa loa]EFO24211.1 elongation factor TS family protein [Loa loa]
MIASRQLIRLIVLKKTFNRLCSVSVVAPTSKTTKEALKELREKTGYSYVNCRKALSDFGVDNLDEAIKWLKKKATEEGWEKAAKLGDRPTRQGVVSVIAKGNKAAIVELNCETDFVSRSEDFKRLVENVAKAVLHATDRDGTIIDGFELLNSSINSLKTSESGELVRDLITEVIGKLGENITLSRAQLILAPPDVQLFGYAHPKEGTDTVCMGRYVSVVGLKRSNKTNFPIEKLGLQLCQHVVGMRSSTLGTPLPLEETTSVKDELPQGDEINAFYDGKVTHIDESETQLLRQPFMLNPSQTVHKYVAGHGASIVDFYRVELSDNLNEEPIQS